MPFFNGGSSGSGGSGGLPVLSGNGAPGSSLGVTGQIYIDSTNNVFYGPKSSSGWPSGISFGAGSYSELTGLPTEFTPEDHSHAISEITNLQTELDAKADSTHAHAIADVTNLQTELDAKATTTALTTAVSDLIDGAPDDLNTLDKLAASIADNAAYATAVNLALAGKSDTTHEHDLDDLTNVAGVPLINQVLQFNGVDWRPATITTSSGESLTTLAQLSDVSSITPTEGDFLSYNGTEWFSTTFSADYSTSSGNLVLSPFTATVEIRGNDGNDGAIQLNCSANSHAVTIQAPPHSANASYTLTLPDDTGSAGQVLRTDGSGGLSWLTVGGGSSSFSFSAVPSADDSTGTVGELALDTLYLYACVATNTWKRIPLQTFSGQTGGGGGSTTGIFISEQPSGGTSQNGNFNLSITATVPSGSTLNYQWQKYNTATAAFDDVSGGVYSSLSLTNLTSSEDGDKYRCFLTSTGHSDVISSEAIIDVTESGVTGVSSTKPSVLFDRSTTLNQQVTNFKGTGGNWSYPGWTLVQEETQWQYSSTNLADVTTIRGSTSPYFRTGEFTSWLKAVPAVDIGYIGLEDYYNYNYSYNSNGYEVLITDAQANDFFSNEPMTARMMATWNQTTSGDGKWNRSARFRTRVVITQTVNGVEEQATTNYSQWSDWRSDPAGNIINENSSTVFTTQPSTTAITLLPNNGNEVTLTNTAEIAGNNKRYVWLLNEDGQAAPTATRNDIDIRGRISHDERRVDSSDQFNDAIDLNVEYLNLNGVGEYDLYCLGAADWNKAAFSSPIPVEIKSTTTNNLTITEMAGGFFNTGVGQQGFGVSAKISDYLNVVDQIQNVKDGEIKFLVQTADSYGANAGQPDWQDFATITVIYDSGGSITNLSDTYWTRQSNTRLIWMFSDIDIEVNNVWHAGVTSVWSKWIYD